MTCPTLLACSLLHASVPFFLKKESDGKEDSRLRWRIESETDGELESLGAHLVLLGWSCHARHMRREPNSLVDGLSRDHDDIHPQQVFRRAVESPASGKSSPSGRSPASGSPSLSTPASSYNGMELSPSLSTDYSDTLDDEQRMLSLQPFPRLTKRKKSKRKRARSSIMSPSEILAFLSAHSYQRQPSYQDPRPPPEKYWWYQPLRFSYLQKSMFYRRPTRQAVERAVSSYVYTDTKMRLMDAGVASAAQRRRMHATIRSPALQSAAVNRVLALGKASLEAMQRLDRETETNPVESWPWYVAQVAYRATLEPALFRFRMNFRPPSRWRLHRPNLLAGPPRKVRSRASNGSTDNLKRVDSDGSDWTRDHRGDRDHSDDHNAEDRESGV